MGNPFFLLHFSSITESFSCHDSRVVVSRDLDWVRNHTSIFCDVSQLSSPAYLGFMMKWIYTVLLTALSLPTPSVFLVPNICLHSAKRSYCWLQMIDSKTIMLPHPHLPVLLHTELCALAQTSCKHLIQTIEQRICIFNSERNWVKGTSVPES